MQLTSASLQRQADALQRLLPALSPSYLPASVPRDLLALAEEEGAQGCQALLEVLAGGGQDVEECSICGEPGEFAVDPEQRESESAVLRTTLFFSPRYEERLLLPIKCVFACGLCRQLRATGSLIQEIATARPGDEGETGEGLLEHLALVNDLVEVAADGNLLAAWGQEVLSRAYALQIASSSTRGWRLGTSDGSQYEAGKPGSAANLALQLLIPELSAQQRDQALANALGREEAVPELTLRRKKSRKIGENGVPDKAAADASGKAVKAGGRKRERSDPDRGKSKKAKRTGKGS